MIRPALEAIIDIGPEGGFARLPILHRYLFAFLLGALNAIASRIAFETGVGVNRAFCFEAEAWHDLAPMPGHLIPIGPAIRSLLNPHHRRRKFADRLRRVALRLDPQTWNTYERRFLLVAGETETTWEVMIQYAFGRERITFEIIEGKPELRDKFNRLALMLVEAVESEFIGLLSVDHSG